MNNYEKRTLTKLHRLYGLLTLLFICACTDVPEYCSDHNRLDPFTQFCYQGKTVNKCNGAEYNPSTQFCYQNKTIVSKCGGEEYDPATQGCYGGTVRSDANVLTIKIEPTGGGTVARSPNQTTYKWGTTVTVTATAANGYKFTGWSDAAADTANSVKVAMDGDKTLTANFYKEGGEQSTYFVYFNANGAKGDAPAAIQRISGGVITLPDQAGLTRDGYSFNGWNTEEGGGGEKYNAHAEYTVTRAVTLFAQWTRNTYTLTTTVSPSGSGTVSRDPNKTTYQYGESVTVTAKPASNFTFYGWSGASSSTIAEITITMDGDKTLTAGFGAPNAKRFTVYFNSNGGGSAPDAASADSGANITLPDQQSMEKNGGYRFVGWNLKSDGTGTNYAANASYKVTGGVTLYAKWIRVYSVTYNGNGTNAGVPNAVDTDSGTAVTLPGQGNMTRTGYTFGGWNTRDDGSGTNYAAGSSYTVIGNVTLYVKWTRITYTVTWNTDSGSPAPTQTSVNHGDSITAPAAMTKTGYTFDKWYTNSALTTAATFPIRNVTANTTLYAKWTPNTYTVTFDAGSGTVSPTSGATNADGKLTLTSLPTPERSGYTFNGWFTSATNGTRVTIDRVYSDNTTIYAQWTAVPTYNVTVSGGGAGAAGGGNYAAGATVSISAGTAPAGQAFDKWTTSNSGVSFANANSAATTFTMPSNAVIVTATWKQTFTDGRDNKTYKKVVIGGKTWMAENLNIVTENSWCYNNSPDSCAKYGRLYTWDAARTACPSGWHLPSRSEWDDLVTAVGSPAGTKLKSTSGWKSSSYNGTDDFKFSALPGGDYGGSSFGHAGDVGSWWTATEGSSGHAYNRVMFYNYDTVGEYDEVKSFGLSVRCVEGAGAALYAVTVTGGTGTGSYAAGATVSITAGTPPTGQAFKNWTVTSGGVTLGNANSATTTFTMPSNAVTVTAVFDWPFKRVTIGGKTWMAENLNIVTENSWCYNNSPDSCAKYGRLYTWDAAKSACPSGWHLPSRGEWDNLVATAGGQSTAGSKLKSTSGWNSYSGISSTDEYGFSALPGGLYNGSSFYEAGDLGYWWTATEGRSGNAYRRFMYYGYDNVFEDYYGKSYGFSVRCVSD